MQTVTATELKNNFGKYLQYVIEGNEVVIMKNGHEVARLISKAKTTEFLCESIRGVLKGKYDDKTERYERENKL